MKMRGKREKRPDCRNPREYQLVVGISTAAVALEAFGGCAQDSLCDSVSTSLTELEGGAEPHGV